MKRIFFRIASAAPMAVSAFAVPSIVNYDFGAVPIVCGQGYSYPAFGGDRNGRLVPQQDFSSTPGLGWTLHLNGDGLTGPNTTFNPPSFAGLPFNPAEFLQGPSWVSQDIGRFATVNYTLSFYLGSRYYSGPFDGNQTVEWLIDGNMFGTWALTSFMPFSLETVSFNVSARGVHTLEFVGTTFGDHTAFLSDVSIRQTATPEPTSLILLGPGVSSDLQVYCLRDSIYS